MPGITAEKVLYSRKGKGELTPPHGTIATGMEEFPLPYWLPPSLAADASNIHCGRRSAQTVPRLFLRPPPHPPQ